MARGGEAASDFSNPMSPVPAVLSLRKPAWQRVASDVVGAIGAPYRFLRLAAITKRVVACIKQEYKAKAKAEGNGTSGGSGASKQLESFIPAYMQTHVIARTSPNDYRRLLNTSLHLILDSIMAKEPYPFRPYHEALRGPGLDHYAWGNDFFRSMVKYRSSRVLGLENVRKIREKLAAGDNVMLIANHQTEADPQVLSILLELEGHGPLAERTIFVAGHKVTTDPLAVPFSMGRNLLTIFSKKYLDTFAAEEKEAKSARNRETVAEMQRLFKEGGHVFWVAPSGGRDRRSAKSGIFEPAAFDEASVGLFLLLSQKAQKAGGPETHFFPLAMWTHKLVPPPDGTQASVGESRSAARAPVGLHFGADMVPDDHGGRKGFPKAIEKAVQKQYFQLDTMMLMLN